MASSPRHSPNDILKNVHLSVQLYTPTGPALTVQPWRRRQLCQPM